MSTTHDAAQRFYDQLRALTDSALGSTVALPRTQVDGIISQIMGELGPAGNADSQLRADLERMADRMLHGGSDAVFSELLTELQADIEATAAESIREGADVSRRPLVRHLTTGQLNAVSMRVPDDSGAYLVLIEDQLQLFASEISRVVARAVPSGDPDAQGLVGFRLDPRQIAQRIADHPEIADSFASVVVTYATTGQVVPSADLDSDLSGSYMNFAGALRRSFDYFVLGHEYAHVLLGHLDSTTSHKGVLPVTDAEALVYSWSDEMAADLFGAILGIQASVNHGDIQLGLAYLGMNLFFDALDVMDRAVALLQTGDEEALQLGSHPPTQLRKQRLREALATMPQLQTDRSLQLADAQEQLFRLLWARTRPALIELRQRGGQAAPTWRPIPRETDPAGAERDGAEQAAGYAQLAVAAQDRGDLTKADEFFAMALRACERLGDRAGAAMYSCQLGIIASLRNRNDEGERYVRRALAGYTELGDKAGTAECHYQLGGRFADDHDSSEAHLETALTLYEQLGERSRSAVINGALGSLAANSGRHRDAERCFARALTIYESLDDRSGIDRCRSSIDQLRESRGRRGLFGRLGGRSRRP